MYPSLVESTTEPELTKTNPNPDGVGVKVEFDESDEKRRDEVGEQDDEPQGERMGLGYAKTGKINMRTYVCFGEKEMYVHLCTGV